MTPLKSSKPLAVPACARAFALCVGACLLPALAPASDVHGAAPQSPAARDGSHDFDFEIGTWKTHVKRLLHPLSGSHAWTEYDGTSIVRALLGGRANVVELTMDGPAGHFAGLSLRLYNPQSRQWSLNFANAAGGVLNTPTIGAFHDGVGEFYDQEMLNERAILVRFVIAPLTKDSCRFEQSFSADGGRTWETNWIATDTRVPAA